jgi:hypothetical protein
MPVNSIASGLPPCIQCLILLADGLLRCSQLQLIPRSEIKVDGAQYNGQPMLRAQLLVQPWHWASAVSLPIRLVILEEVATVADVPRQ